MSKLTKCDKCRTVFSSDSEQLAHIDIRQKHQTKGYDLCEHCQHVFLTDFLGLVYNDVYEEYFELPQEVKI